MTIIILCHDLCYEMEGWENILMTSAKECSHHTHAPTLPRKPLTPIEDGTMMGQLALALQRGAVPALVSQLMLTLMDSHLDTLQGGRRHIRAAHTQAHLALTQASQS